MDMPTHTTNPPLGMPCSKKTPNFVTILILPNQNWYHNPNPHERPFPNSHIITHLKGDIIIYYNPTTPHELQIEPKTKSHAIQILCTHHKNTFIGSDKHT